MNEHNFVRAETLSLGSLEFFSLLAIIIYAIVKHRGNLYHSYILFLPFTDQVYRIADLQIADVLGLLIVFKNINIFKLRVNKLFLCLLTILIAGSLNGILYHGDYFPALYSARVIIILLTALTIAQRIEKDPRLLDSISKTYRFIVLFSVAIAFLQAILWLLGLPIDGVFFTDYIRVKGLAHEPSTFGIWLALATPVAIKYSKTHKKAEIDYLVLAAIALGIMLTSSASAILTLLVIALFFFTGSKGVRNKYFIASAALALALLTSILFYDVLYNSVILKLMNYVAELNDPTLEDLSGRGGDRYLLLLLSASPLTGIGAFRSSRVEEILLSLGIDAYVPGSNFYITTIVEYGIIAGPTLIVLFLGWFFLIMKASIKTSNHWGYSVGGWFIALAAMRIFGFHQPWLNYALFLAERSKEKKLEERGKPVKPKIIARMSG